MQPVRQPGQIVVVGEVRHPLLGQLAGGDVAPDLGRARSPGRRASTIGDTVSDTCTSPPSLRTRTVSRFSIGSPAPDQRQHRRRLVGAAARLDERDPLPDRLGGGVAVQPLGTGVPRLDHAVERLRDDRVLGRLDDRGQVVDGPLGPPALADVAHVEHPQAGVDPDQRARSRPRPGRWLRRSGWRSPRNFVDRRALRPVRSAAASHRAAPSRSRCRGARRTCARPPG